MRGTDINLSPPPVAEPLWKTLVYATPRGHGKKEKSKTQASWPDRALLPAGKLVHHGYHTWAPGAQKRVVLDSSHWRLEGTIIGGHTWFPIVLYCKSLKRAEVENSTVSNQRPSRRVGVRRRREKPANLLLSYSV